MIPYNNPYYEKLFQCNTKRNLIVYFSYNDNNDDNNDTNNDNNNDDNDDDEDDDGDTQKVHKQTPYEYWC